MIDSVEGYLRRTIRKDGAVHLTLLDPEEVKPESVFSIAEKVQSCSSCAIMIGGTTLVSTSHLDEVVKSIRKAVDIPVILFPNNVTGISRYAHAIWFMSLLNSADPYFIAGAQVLGAPLVKMYGLEAIPLGYIIAGRGGSVGVIGRACPIPYDRPELAAAYALAAQYFGMRYVYLEAGSRAEEHIPSEMVRTVRKAIDIPLIAGGGIRTREQVREIVSAGADVIVTSTVLEESGEDEIEAKLGEIIQGIREGVNNREV
jgi:phosphoglycerol geranylgeranyltransferase